MTPITLLFLRPFARAAALTLATAALMLLAADAPRPAHAAGMVVNTLADANPPLTDGLCSLREAITNANANAATWPDCPAGAGADTITFSVSGTVVLASILPDIADAAGLVIDGAGQSVTVSGNGVTRGFRISAAASAEIRTLTVSGGRLAFGGGVYVLGSLKLINATLSNGIADQGSAIYNALGSVTMIDTTVVGNNPPPGITASSAIYSTGTLSVTRGVISGNGGPGINASGTTVITHGAVTNNNGDGIFHAGPLTLSDALVRGNQGSGIGTETGGMADIIRTDVSENGGTGVRKQSSGLVTITDSFIRMNGGPSGGLDGGGVLTSGPMRVTRTVVEGNKARGSGGGGINNTGSSIIDASTVNNNSSVNAPGGGGVRNSGSGSLTIVNSTISGNRALAGTTCGLNCGAGGGVRVLSGTATLVNTTVAGNTAESSGNGGGGVLNVGGTLRVSHLVAFGNTSPCGQDCAGIVTFTGVNLVGDTSGCDVTGTPPIVANPLLEPLAPNTGPTYTHALGPGSPARDVGDLAVCLASPVNGVDQR